MKKTDLRFSAGSLEKSLIGIVEGLEKALSERGAIRVVPEGETAIRQGETLRRLLIPLDHPMLLRRQRDGEEMRHIGYLQQGRVACLRHLLDQVEAPYDVVAERPTAVIELGAIEFNALVDAAPYLRQYLLLMTRSPGVRSLKRFLEDQGVEQSTLVELIGGHVKPVALETTTELQPEQKLIYLLDGGIVQITFEDETRTAISEGAWFGAEAAIPPTRWSYHAYVEERTEAHALSVEALTSLVTQVSVLEAIAEEPWISRARTQTRRVGAQTVSKTEIQAQRLSPHELTALGIRVDPTSLRACADDTESAACSLFNLSLFLDARVSATNISNDLRIAGKVTLHSMAQAIEPYGFVTSALKCGFEQLHRQVMPCIVALGERVVVLLRVSERAAIVADPTLGYVMIAREEFERLWNRRILEVLATHTNELYRADASAAKPGPVKDKLEEARSNALLKALIRWVKPFRKLLVNQGLLAVLGITLGMVGPKISGVIIDEALTVRSFEVVGWLFAGIMLVILAEAANHIAQQVLSMTIAQRVALRVTSIFHRHSMGMNAAVDGRDRVGEYMGRQSMLMLIVNFITSAPLSVGLNIFQIVVYTGILIAYDWRIAMVGFVSVPLLTLAQRAMRRRMREDNIANFELNKRFTSTLNEHVSGIGAVKALGAERLLRERLEDNNIKIKRLTRSLSLRQMAMAATVGVVTNITGLLCLVFALMLVSKGEISFGAAFAIKAYAASLNASITALSEFVVQFEMMRHAWGRVAEAFASGDSDHKHDPTQRHSLELRGKIKLDRVNFRYSPDLPWVLRDVQLTIFPRQLVAIVGRSGCGKSTLAKVIAGETQPSSGRVFYDGCDSEFLTRHSVRRQIGVVIQEAKLLSGTISDNVHYADDLPDNSKMVLSTVQSGAQQFISELPNNFSYFLAEGGLGLSGGQKQRIAIARILYQDPKILVMDEATSALDAESEGAVMARLDEVRQNKTVIMIAHRLSTIRNADRIIVMDNGEVVGDGTHSSLLHSNEHYAALFSNQVAPRIA